MKDCIIGWRYWNCGDVAVAIVAVRSVTGSWYACIGGTTKTRKEITVVLTVASEGHKLGERIARSVFPGTEGHYRE